MRKACQRISIAFKPSLSKVHLEHLMGCWTTKSIFTEQKQSQKGQSRAFTEHTAASAFIFNGFLCEFCFI